MQQQNNLQVKTRDTVTKIAIVGLPNTGKSRTFNLLTGAYNLVSNYPLTTVEIRSARCLINGRDYEVFDTPGLHSVFIHSEEELVVRDMLFTHRPDMLIQCFDANQIKQSLSLTADLIELGIPMIIVLNAIEETALRGMRVDSKRLSGLLNLPVIEILSLHDNGREKLCAALPEAQKPAFHIEYSVFLEKSIKEIEALLPDEVYYKRKMSVLLLEKDRFMLETLKKTIDSQQFARVVNRIEPIHREFYGNIGLGINQKRDQWVDSVYDAVVKKKKFNENIFLKAFGNLSRHPVWGVIILLFFIAITYLLVVHVAGFFERLLTDVIVDPSVTFLSKKITKPLLSDFLIGHYGIVTLGIFNAFCTVLPILSVFFLTLGLMEDIGYIPNLCVLTNRLFKKIGITGKTIMPLVLGFGCKTMATLTTRGLQSRKEKIIAIFLIAFAIPCSAQLGLNMAILGRIGVRAFVVAVSILVTVEILAGFILNKIIKEDKQSEFIQELPIIRMPNLHAIVEKTYFRLQWFIKEALPFFIIASVVLFFLDKSGGLLILRNALKPVIVVWLGLPLEMVDALILTMARHEASSGLILNMVDLGQLDYVQCIVAVTLTTMFVPCFANIVAMCRELGLKTGLYLVAVINFSSFVLGGLIRLLLEAVFQP